MRPVPEGDSVYQLARRLRFVEGCEVTHTSIRVPNYAVASFDGARCRRVWPYGKHLFMQFDEQILHTHLKMEGTWAFHPAGTRWKKPGYTARVVLRLWSQALAARGFDEVELVGHSLGFVKVYDAAELEAHTGHLGPDVLGTQWDPQGRDEAVRRVLARPERSVGAALMDQTNLAGIGNEYRAEICFLCGVHPETTVAAVGKAGVDKLVDTSRALMWANKDSPLRVTTGVRRPGENAYVFGRYSKPCRRCGTLIEKSTLGGDDPLAPGELERIIWWCPRCQPLLG